MIALVLLLAAIAPDDGPEAAVADQVIRCGIDRTRVSVTDGAYAGDTPIADIAIATPDSALTRDQLDCLVRLATAGNWIRFGDPAAQARFDPLAGVALPKARLLEARQWLTDHHLLDRLPSYDPARDTLADIAVSLRALCGITGGVTLKAEGNALTLMGPDSNADEAGLASYKCLHSAAIVVSADPQRFYVSVVFNGAARHP